MTEHYYFKCSLFLLDLCVVFVHCAVMLVLVFSAFHLIQLRVFHTRHTGAAFSILAFSVAARIDQHVLQNHVLLMLSHAPKSGDFTWWWSSVCLFVCSSFTPTRATSPWRACWAARNSTTGVPDFFPLKNFTPVKFVLAAGAYSWRP